MKEFKVRERLMFSSKLRTGPRVVPHDYTYALLVILHHHSPAGQLAAATSSPTALPHGRRAPPCRRRRLLHVLPSSSSPPLSATLSSSPYQPYRYSPAPRIYLSLSLAYVAVGKFDLCMSAPFAGRRPFPAVRAAETDAKDGACLSAVAPLLLSIDSSSCVCVAFSVGPLL
jgi:hypothetical protein